MPRDGEVDTRYTQDRELSWLKFNERVMEEAWDPSVPVFERLKFAAIFTSNLDEFFMVRVGSIGDLALLKGRHRDSRSGLTPDQQLRAIFRAVRPLYRRRDKLLAALEAKLRTYGVCCLLPQELDGKEEKQMERWFRDQVVPVLSPMVVDSHHPFPHLPSKQSCVVLSLRREGREYLGLVPIPRTLSPFWVLEEPGLRYVLTEQVVLAMAPTLFGSYCVTSRAIMAVTRNADLPPEDEDREESEDFRQHMKKALKKRARLSPVRLELQGELAEHALAHLKERLGLSEERVFLSRSPLSLDYVYSLEARLPSESTGLRYPPFSPVWARELDRKERLIPQLLRRDLLLFYPYHSMEPFLQLIREAAGDPEVLSIKITIYRLASQAKLVEYLAAAAENGKEVTVFMELRARFDEQNNIRWAERLEEAGCTLLYGVEGYKVHSKLCLITRRDHGKVRTITQIGTGNYNEKTARLYTDLSLITAHPGIGADAAALFQDLAVGDLQGEYPHLLVAPHSLRPALLSLIDREMAKGPDGFLFLKMNAITDRVLIDKLAQASQAGVRIIMNVRGICCLRPGVEGLTDRIRVFSIVGRFLEHARLFVFGKGEDALFYISSADFMTRNTQRRVEVACPVLDPGLRLQLAQYVDILCQDNEKARSIQPDGSWAAPVPKGQTDCQTALLRSLPACPLPEASAPAPPGQEGLFSRLFHGLRLN